jgi:hypothetical protein
MTNFALGEIDHAGRFVDQRKPHGDQAIGCAAHEPGGDEQRQEIHQAALP